MPADDVISRWSGPFTLPILTPKTLVSILSFLEKFQENSLLFLLIFGYSH